MSVWADIHRRAHGVQERKENLVWDPLDSPYKSANIIDIEIAKLRNSCIQLGDRISELKNSCIQLRDKINDLNKELDSFSKKELDFFRWEKKPIYKNYKK